MKMQSQTVTVTKSDQLFLFFCFSEKLWPILWCYQQKPYPCTAEYYTFTSLFANVGGVN